MPLSSVGSSAATFCLRPHNDNKEYSKLEQKAELISDPENGTLESFLTYDDLSEPGNRAKHKTRRATDKLCETVF